ncbi:MAG: hypothetical protein AAB225_26720 [Acidobacteriota bacterium]
MFQMLAIVISVGSIGWAFFSPLWAWTPLVTAAALLLLTLLGVKQKKWRYIEELSPAGNEMLPKFGHYYAMPFAGRDFSAAASTIQFAAVAVGIIGAVKGFYWGLGIAVAFWFVLGPVAMAFNPTNFIRGSHLESAHEEVISWVMQQSQRGRS